MKTKYKIIAALLMLVVFGLGVAAGVLGERYLVHKKDRRASVNRPHPPSPEEWAKELGLTEDQQTRIREIFKSNEERMRAYRTESRARLGELRKRLWDETNAVLTPEQKAKNDAMIRRFEERRKQEAAKSGPDRTNPRDRRGDDPPPPDRER
jgi:Spy/CpxP family protein refolding chaperone